MTGSGLAPSPVASLVLSGPGCEWQPQCPTRALRPAGACRPSCPCRLFWDLPGRARWHRATLPGPRLSQCRLRVPGPSPWRPRGVTGGGSTRAESRPRRAGALNKEAQRSCPSGARAVLRAKGPAPWIPVFPGTAPPTRPARGTSYVRSADISCPGPRVTRVVLGVSKVSGFSSRSRARPATQLAIWPLCLRPGWRHPATVAPVGGPQHPALGRAPVGCVVQPISRRRS